MILLKSFLISSGTTGRLMRRYQLCLNIFSYRDGGNLTPADEHGETSIPASKWVIIMMINNDSLLHIAFHLAVRRRYCHCLCHPPPVKQTLVTALTPPCLLRHAHRAALSHCHSAGPERVRGEKICSCAFLFDRPLV